MLFFCYRRWRRLSYLDPFAQEQSQSAGTQKVDADRDPKCGAPHRGTHLQAEWQGRIHPLIFALHLACVCIFEFGVGVELSSVCLKVVGARCVLYETLGVGIPDFAAVTAASVRKDNLFDAYAEEALKFDKVDIIVIIVLKAHRTRA